MNLFGDITYISDLVDAYLNEIERSFNLAKIKNVKRINTIFSDDGFTLEIKNMENEVKTLLLHPFSDYSISFTKDDIDNMFVGIDLDHLMEDNRLSEEVIFNKDNDSLIILKKEKITQYYAYSGYLIDAEIIDRIESFI